MQIGHPLEACATIPETKRQLIAILRRSVVQKMPENESTPIESAAEATGDNAATENAPTEDISYHAVEKDGVVTAIWEMQGRKHVKTIDPRSRHGQDILRLYTTEHHDEPAPEASEAATS